MNREVRELIDQQPPADIEAERCVLGSFLLNPTLFDGIQLEIRDFHDDSHQLIFAAMRHLRGQGKPVDPVLVCERLKEVSIDEKNALEHVGDLAYLTKLFSSVPNAAHAAHYAKTIRALSLKRRVGDVGLNLFRMSRDGMAPDDLLAYGAEQLSDLRNSTDEGPGIVTIGEMIDTSAGLRPFVIDGLVRRGETANIIADPKRGKSWLAYGLALSVVTGRDWLDTFPVAPGRVLLIDNELHPETIPHRIQTVTDAMGIPDDHYRDRLDVVSLRGRLQDIIGIGSFVDTIESGAYQAIIVDAFYRMFPSGVSENDNAAMAGVYNLIDKYAARTSAAWLMIHHSTKGSQSDKAVTDVGAGAGRAASSTGIRGCDERQVQREGYGLAATLWDAGAVCDCELLTVARNRIPRGQPLPELAQV